MQEQITYKELNELDEVAEKIVKFANDLKIWTFEGNLGAGKTTLIQSLGKYFEVIDTVRSPTYSLVNEYLTKKGETIYHFDLYRIKDENEVLDLGYEEYFYDDKYCWIEWASKTPDLIPSKHLAIQIMVETDKRIIDLQRYE